MLKTSSKIFIAGHRGMVGSSLERRLRSLGFNNLVFRSSRELDLTNQNAVQHFFSEEKPEFVFLAAAKVGGILANNSYPAEFIYNNLMIESNVIHSSYLNNVKKLLFLGSSCIYPKYANQPIHEDELLSGYLEPTNEAYAIAKIAGIELCKFYRRQYGVDYISVMPTNLYGINDNFDLETSHVLPSLIRRFHEAKKSNSQTVQIWGSGNPKREFLFVDDLADACIHLMMNYSDEKHVNVGTGSDVKVSELAHLISGIVGYTGGIVYDVTKPDGTPRKLLNVDYLHSLGWKHKTNLEEGIKVVYKWYVDNYSNCDNANTAYVA